MKQQGYSYITYEDPTCSVRCCCGKEVWTSDYKISICECRRGYRTEFRVHSYSLTYLKYLTVQSTLIAKIVALWSKLKH